MLEKRPHACIVINRPCIGVRSELLLLGSDNSLVAQLGPVRQAVMSSKLAVL
jgi:hypothetical protein